MIIGINGKISAGKDTVGTIIQGLLLTNKNQSSEIKKFAGKLKQIASILTGISVEKFEDQEFKNTILGEQWGTIEINPLNAIPVFEDVQFNHLMSVREFLQKLGTEAMRKGLHTNVWVNALFADYRKGEIIESDKHYILKPVDNWIITDMRFPNEMEAVKERKGITIKVVRPSFMIDGKVIAKDLHPSETALDDAKFDYEIINNGTMEELVKKVREILVLEELI
jgi:hypothetical protein